MAENTNNEFKPIETQEAFDAAIKDRLERAERSVRKEYENYETYKTNADEFDTKVSDYDKQISDLKAENEKLKGDITSRETAAEKSRIAREAGLPEGFENRLTGSAKEEWQKDAQQLAGFFKKLYPSKNHRLGAFLMFCSLQKLEHFLERFSERCFVMTVNETTIKHA